MSSKRLGADELKALMALGVLGGFAIIFELSNFGVFTYLIGKPSIGDALLELYAIAGDAFAFGVYVALFTLALAFESFPATKEWAKSLEKVSDIWFLIGAFGLFVVGTAFFIRAVGLPV